MYAEFLPKREPKETFSSVELSLYAMQNKRFYEQFVFPIIEIQAKKIVVGSYTPETAVTAFFSVVNLAALKYEFEFGDVESARQKVITCFDYDDRKEAALMLLHANIGTIIEKAKELEL